MIEITCNDRLGKKCRVKCDLLDTIGELKQLIALHIGTPAEKLILKKASMVYKDTIDLDTYEIHDGFEFELHYK